MIEFILGKTGGGKSYAALCKFIVPFLAEHPDGVVVHNLAIDDGKLNAYMKRKFPKVEPDVCNRIRRLTDEETREFYLHREFGSDLAPTSKEQQKNGVFPAFEDEANRTRFVLYIIDEAHLFFDARNWASVGDALNFFCSQHRKFKCDIVFITQFLKQVELRLREHATRFAECANWGVRQWALWNLPCYLRIAYTYKAPPCPSEHGETYRMDMALADCYDTTAGVGVRGGRKPELKKRNGLPFWTLCATAACLLVAAWWLPDLVLKGSLMALSGGETALRSTVGQVGGTSLTAEPSKAPQAGQKGDPLLTPGEAKALTSGPRVGSTSSAPVRVTGYAVRGNRAVVQLSDGRRVTEADAEFGGIERRGNAVWVDGQKLWLVTPARPQSDIPVKASPIDGKGAPEASVAPVGGYSGETVEASPESKEAAARASQRTVLMGGMQAGRAHGGR